MLFCNLNIIVIEITKLEPKQIFCNIIVTIYE